GRCPRRSPPPAHGSRPWGCAAGLGSRTPSACRPGRRSSGPARRDNPPCAGGPPRGARSRGNPRSSPKASAGREGQPAILGPFPQQPALLGRHLGDAPGEGERRELESLIAEVGHGPADLVVVPSLERFVADGVTHGASS